MIIFIHVTVVEAGDDRVMVPVRHVFIGLGLVILSVPPPAAYLAPTGQPL
jgi:hypothetical protein